MGVFGEALTTLVSTVGMLPGLCFFVFTVTSLAPVFPQFTSPPPPPPLLPASTVCRPSPAVVPSPTGLASSVCVLTPAVPSPRPRRRPRRLASTPAVPMCPASPPAHPTPDELKYKISSWGRLSVMFMCMTVILIGMVRPRVEAAAKAETRAASQEEDAYKSAKEDLLVAMKAVDVAIKAVDTAIEQVVHHLGIRSTEGFVNDYVFPLTKDINLAVKKKHAALEKAMQAKPLLGLARMSKCASYLHRICFLLAIWMSFATWFCAGGAFYRSIELQMGEKPRADIITCFAIPTFLAAVLHLYDSFIALFED